MAEYALRRLPRVAGNLQANLALAANGAYLAGALHHPAIHAYPLQDIAAAHEAVETRRHMGKVIVQP
ncbi:hypothetical protein FQZ97_628680 [compost metagenome]